MSKVIETLREYVPYKDLQNDSISNWSVGNQIEHCTKVIYGICHTLKNSNPDEYNGSFNITRTIFLTLGKFPRGKAKAPKTTQPLKQSSEEELLKYLQKAEDIMKEIENLPKNAFFNHPYFKHVNLKQAKNFMGIHTNHHVAIIKDIIKAES